jgi:hypothetical protein
MHTVKILYFFLAFIIAGTTSGFAGVSSQLGAGYGKEFKNNEDLAQYEIFWRQPLPYKTTLGDNWNISTGIELAAALITESGSGHTGTGRFSLMPQVVVSPHEMVHFILGFGAGYMAGPTEFTHHDLGGNFLFNSKVGVQLLFGDHWGLEYVFYHQSNAGIYDHNASLNMNQLALVYNF